MRTRNRRWICFVMLFVSSIAFAGGVDESSSISEIVDNRFEQSQIYAQNILKKYPPSEFVIWGLGRTTGLVAERLRQLSEKEDYVFEVPVESIAEIIKLGPFHQNLFFERILPSPEVLQGRHLVLFRVLWHSISMSLISQPLIDYLKFKKYPLPLHAYFISDKKAEELPLFKNPENKSYLKDMFIHLVVDPDFQRKYREELNFDTYIKGMTRLGKYLPAHPSEIISSQFIFQPNPLYQKLEFIIQKDLESREQDQNSCFRVFSDFWSRFL